MSGPGEAHFGAGEKRRDALSIVQTWKRAFSINFAKECLRWCDSVAHSVAHSLRRERVHLSLRISGPYDDWVDIHYFQFFPRLLFRLDRWRAIDRDTLANTHTHTRARERLKSGNKCETEWMAQITCQRTTRIYFIGVAFIVYYYFMFPVLFAYLGVVMGSGTYAK